MAPRAGQVRERNPAEAEPVVVCHRAAAVKMRVMARVVTLSTSICRRGLAATRTVRCLSADSELERRGRSVS